MFAAAVAAAVAALIFFIGIFGDEGVAGWGWAVAIALAAGAVAALVWGARTGDGGATRRSESNRSCGRSRGRRPA